jgi:hypothetical protein
MGTVRGWISAAVGALLAAGAAGVMEVEAQEDWASLPAPVLMVVGGGFSYDFDGTGSGTLAGLRVAFPLTRLVSVEPGVERLAWKAGDPATNATRWVADFALRGAYPVGRVEPYAGGNVGVIVDFDEDRPTDQKFVDVGYGGHGGVAVAVAPRLSLRGEVRARWFDGGAARWLLYTLGVGWRF